MDELPDTVLSSQITVTLVKAYQPDGKHNRERCPREGLSRSSKLTRGGQLSKEKQKGSSRRRLLRMVRP